MRTSTRGSPLQPLSRTTTIAVLLAAIAAAVLPGIATAQQGPAVVRVEGPDRFATAAEAAEVYGPGVERVLIATGRDDPDALAGAPLAGRMQWPILLVEQDSIPAPTAAALDRLEPVDITVLGGDRAVSDRVQRQLGQYTSGTVDRLQGPDRYATAAAIADEYYDGGVPVVFVATGLDFADALAAAPAATLDAAPLLLVTRRQVPTPTRTSLMRLRPDRIVVLGGTHAVSEEVEAELADMATSGVDRLEGPDRYATAASVAAAAFPGTAPTVYLATGQAFPDALAGGAIAGAGEAPLLTTRQHCVPDLVVDQVERLDPSQLVVLGGERVVSDEAAGLLRCSQVGSSDVTVTTITDDLRAPWDLVFTPDGGRFLTERDSGRVLRLTDENGPMTVTTFPVDNDGEGGLLGLAVSPTYDQDPYLYAMYVSEPNQDQRVVRFRPSGVGLETVISGLPRGSSTNSTHFAGRIDFGPDGMLYVTVGDVQDRASAQDPQALSGKILRYTPTGGIPDDNPFGNPVWAYGLRDPQGLAWDAAGRMYASEFGPDRDDEINRVIRGGNYGWPEVTGTDGGDGRFIDPLVVRQPSEASWSGTSVLVDGAIPAWEGDLFAAGLRGERLYRVDLDDDGQVTGVEAVLDGHGRLRHVVPAPDGSLWILTNNCDTRGSCPSTGDRILRLGP